MSPLDHAIREIARTPCRGVYIAAPLAEAPRANEARTALLNAGVLNVVSEWHRTTEKFDPADPAERARVLLGNITDLELVDRVLYLSDRGTPRAANVEIGYALARGVQVFWVQGPNGEGANLFDAHPLVRVFR